MVDTAQGSLHARPADDQLWQWLAEIPDPEIPVISVVDLGIVRAARWDQDTLVVTVTPTYTGCPATRVINDDIVAHLRLRGIADVRIERQLSPAWTTQWMTAKGREKLRAYGIRVVACPRCASVETERVSQFGSTPCKAVYRCRSCLEPFDHFKCI